LESGGVDHSRSLYHRPQAVGRRPSIQSWDITCSTRRRITAGTHYLRDHRYSGVGSN
jgi:hypothetical protein